MARLLAALLLMTMFPVLAFAHSESPIVTIKVLSDGACQIEGQRFSSGKDLKAKIDQLEYRKPKPEVRIFTSQPNDFKTLGHVILLLQQAGVAKIGFLVEPAKK